MIKSNLKNFSVIRGATKTSNKSIGIIDLTKYEDIKEEPLLDHNPESSIYQYSFKILIERVSLLHH